MYTLRVGSLYFLVFLHYCYEWAEMRAGVFTHDIGSVWNPVEPHVYTLAQR